MADVEYYGFIWDKNKAEINKQKHGIDFETAVRIFNDPCLYVGYDKLHSTLEEEREINIGLLNGILFLTVITTDRNNKKRIISARKAIKKEVEKYVRNAKSLQTN